ncbi:hypothetical protein DFH08DRAFT_810610 [Mycena albidolilacea]|uniref:Fatty acid desaturase domain-containing protein n=1 Tax=Mycena albidolilacea TaxID=1033008 RepID=A0AAD6ZYH4_9AGAR|nr:hypothetical protein DFH08DRAFT_810610 [Mycena albidolilacea]
MQESAKVNRIQTAEPQDENLRIAFKEALAISNQHKGRSNLWGSLIILSNYVVIAGCIAVSEYSVKCLNRRAVWGIYSLMALVISSRLRAFEHMVHEASHNNLFTLPCTSSMYSAPCTSSTTSILAIPSATLTWSGSSTMGSFLIPPSASRKTWLILGLPWTGWFQYEYVNTLFTEFWMDSSCYPSKLIYWIVVLSAVHFSDRWTEFGWYYVIPWLGIFPILRWWAELGEHVGMDMTKDFGNSRTNDRFWQRWFFYPLNDGLHAAHHLNSQVPCYRLRRAQAELMAESTAFREKNVLANSMWETYSQIYTCTTIIKERVEGGFG